MDWTIEGKKQLKSIVCKICDLEIAYGLPKKDPVKICKSLQLWLAKDLTAEQVAYAVDRLSRKSTRVPLPSEIIKFCSPDPEPITNAEYIQACRSYERNGYNAHGPDKHLMDLYIEQKNHREIESKDHQEKLASLSYHGLKIIEKDDRGNETWQKSGETNSMKPISSYLRGA